MPHAPDWFLGLTDGQGESVPTVDVHVRLGLSPVEPTLATYVLFADVGAAGGKPLSLGMVVDRVRDMSTFSAESVEDAPDLDGRCRSEKIKAILRRGGGFLALLDPAGVFGAHGARTALADFGMAA